MYKRQVQGSVSGYKIQTDKKGTTQVSISVTGIGISSQIWITMYKGSHEASVEILPNFNSRRLTLNGVILPLHTVSYTHLGYCLVKFAIPYLQ